MPEFRLPEERLQTQSYRKCLVWKLIPVQFFFFPALGMFPTKSANKAFQYGGLVIRKYWREGGEFLFLDELYQFWVLVEGEKGEKEIRGLTDVSLWPPEWKSLLWKSQNRSIDTYLLCLLDLSCIKRKRITWSFKKWVIWNPIVQKLHFYFSFHQKKEYLFWFWSRFLFQYLGKQLNQKYGHSYSFQCCTQ